MPATLEALLDRTLPEYGFAPDAAARRRFARFLELVVAGQARARLVGRADPETLVRRHLGESLYLGQVLPLGHQRLLDLGSGAGFPGLALALGWPGLNTTLVESTAKKAAFLRQTIAALELAPRVSVWEGFVNRRPPVGRAPLAEVELVTLRALEHMEHVPEWLGRWLDPGTIVALWVGSDLAARWRACGAVWSAGEFHPLPDSRGRGILIVRFT